MTVIKIYLRILKNLHVFSNSEYEIVVFEIASLYPYLRTFVTLTSDGWICFIHILILKVYPLQFGVR